MACFKSCFKSAVFAIFGMMAGFYLCSPCKCMGRSLKSLLKICSGIGYADVKSTPMAATE